MSLVKFIAVLCYYKGNYFLISISQLVGLEYVFCILSLYPKTLLNPLINCGRFYGDSLEFST